MDNLCGWLDRLKSIVKSWGAFTTRSRWWSLVSAELICITLNHNMLFGLWLPLFILIFRSLSFGSSTFTSWMVRFRRLSRRWTSR